MYAKTKGGTSFRIVDMVVRKLGGPNFCSREIMDTIADCNILIDVLD